MMFFRSLILAVFFFFLSISNAISAPAVMEQDVIEAIRKEFVENGKDEELDIEIFSGQTYFEPKEGSLAKILISDLKLVEEQNKFSAKVEVFVDGKFFEGANLSGKYYVLGDVYVPSVNVAKGETLTDKKLKAIKVRMNRIKPGNIIDKQKLVGMEAKRYLKEGKIVNDKEIGEKVVIRKGQVVTMIFKNSKMVITTKVEALQDGAKGERIDVMNVKSKKVISADVADENTVEADTGL